MTLKAKEITRECEGNSLTKCFPGHQPALDCFNKTGDALSKTREQFYFSTSAGTHFSNPAEKEEPKETLTFMSDKDLKMYRQTWTKKQAREMKTEYQRQHDELAKKRSQYNK